MSRKEPRIPVSTRLRITDMATVARWLHESNIPVRNPSELCHQAVKALAENLENLNQVRYTDVEAGLKLLNSLGMQIKTSSDTRVGKAASKALQFNSLLPPGEAEAKQELQASFNLLREKLGLGDEGQIEAPDLIQLPEAAPDFQPPTPNDEVEDEN